MDFPDIVLRILGILHTNINKRLPLLKQFQGQVERLNYPVFSNLLKGLCDFYSARENIQRFRISRTEDTSFREESAMRREAIKMANSSVKYLEKAKLIAEKEICSKKYKRIFNAIVQQFVYLAKNFRCRQVLVLHMNNLEYDKARKIAQEGLDLAIDGLMYGSQEMTIDELLKPPFFQVDINFYQGNLKEIDAYERLCDKKFWEIESEDFLEVARLFDDSAKDLEKAADTSHDLDVLTSIPRAWSCLLKFMARPTLAGLEFLAEFKKLESSELVRKHFSPPVTRKISRRRQRAEAMSRFFRNNVVKVACWNIFSELHYNINIIETYLNEEENKELLRNKLKTAKIPEKRLEMYNGHLTYERAIDDVDNYLHRLLPLTIHKKEKPSLLVAKDLYYYCKHEKIQTDFYSTRRDEFAEEFMEKALQDYKSLLALNLDRKRFLEILEKMRAQKL